MKSLIQLRSRRKLLEIKNANKNTMASKKSPGGLITDIRGWKKTIFFQPFSVFKYHEDNVQNNRAASV